MLFCFCYSVTKHALESVFCVSYLDNLQCFRFRKSDTLYKSKSVLKLLLNCFQLFDISGRCKGLCMVTNDCFGVFWNHPLSKDSQSVQCHLQRIGESLDVEKLKNFDDFHCGKEAVIDSAFLQEALNKKLFIVDHDVALKKDTQGSSVFPPQ